MASSANKMELIKQEEGLKNSSGYDSKYKSIETIYDIDLNFYGYNLQYIIGSKVMNKAYMLASVIILIATSSAHSGVVVSVGGQDCCRYIVDGVPQTKYCTSTGVSCKSDGTCTVTSDSGRSIINGNVIKTYSSGSGGKFNVPTN